jgi:outer membrane receptor protein involved in Fe transport
MKSRVCLFLAVLFLAVNGVCADDILLSIERSGKTYGESLSQVYTIDEEEIEMENVPMALDLLENAPGVFVNKTGTAGRADPSIRGLGDSGRALAMFVDGRPEKMSVYNCVVSQSLLNAGIAGIEVFKGPNSVLWGNGALGGAINIITRRPTKAFEGDVEASYGTFNTQNYKMFIGSNTEKFIFSVSADRITTDGHLANSAFDAGAYALNTVYKINKDNEISFTGRYFEGIKYEPAQAHPVSPTGALLPPTGINRGWNNFQRGSLDLTYLGYLAATNIKIKTFADIGNHNFSDGWDSKDNTLGAFAHLNTALFENNALTYGFETQREQGKVLAGSPAPGTYTRYGLAGFVLDEHKFSNGITAAAGVRYNYDEISGDFWAPQAKLSYDITHSLKVRAIYSKAFRTPYINELYTVPPSNPNLKAEDATNYEVGFSADIFKIKDSALNFDASAFMMEGDNVIEVQSGKFANGGDYRFKGVELAAKMPFAGNGSHIFAGYTYLDSGDKTQGRPGTKIDATINYNFYKFKTSLGAMHIGDYYAGNDKNGKLPDYTIFNFKVDYAVTEAFTIFGAADNFTNEKYDIFTVSYGNSGVYLMPGITATAGVKYNF